jgi:GTP-binding protein
MNIKTIKFVKGIKGTDDILYDGKFQVAFMGRSNVGKSTLINSLARRNTLARSSRSPGKTIRMDFFLVNDSFYFVDFPGYGYASRSGEHREKLAKMILWYLMYSNVTQRVVVLIIDAKVGITDFDRDMLKTIREFKVDHVIIANKVDKLQTGQRDTRLEKIRLEAGDSEVIAHSAVKKIGREDILKRIAPISK